MGELSAEAEKILPLILYLQEESLESLAREVLRSQPKNIYEFAAKHFEEQLRKRNKGES